MSQSAPKPLAMPTLAVLQQPNMIGPALPPMPLPQAVPHPLAAFIPNNTGTNTFLDAIAICLQNTACSEQRRQRMEEK
jgi:hypothetical protein